MAPPRTKSLSTNKQKKVTNCFTMPAEVLEALRRHPEVNWSAFVTRAIQEELISLGDELYASGDWLLTTTVSSE